MFIDRFSAHCCSTLRIGLCLVITSLGFSAASVEPSSASEKKVPSNLEEKYNITFNNKGTGYLVLKKGLVDCMHNSGPEQFTLAPKGSYSFEIDDSNNLFSICVNADKQINWRVFKGNDQLQVNGIRFDHRKSNGNWVTLIKDDRGSVEATCEGVPCSNTGTPGVPYDGPIVINIPNQ